MNFWPSGTTTKERRVRLLDWRAAVKTQLINYGGPFVAFAYFEEAQQRIRWLQSLIPVFVWVGFLLGFVVAALVL